MSKRHDALPQIRLWPANKRRLKALKDKHPFEVPSVTMLANYVLARSLKNFEENSDWIGEPLKP